jgi:N-acetylglucosamine-6-phosphate deacetylase
VPLVDAIRMASLTPARIAGVADRYGSLAVCKAADFVVLDEALNVESVWISGGKVYDATQSVS